MVLTAAGVPARTPPRSSPRETPPRSRAPAAHPRAPRLDPRHQTRRLDPVFRGGGAVRGRIAVACGSAAWGRPRPFEEDRWPDLDLDMWWGNLES